jgi:hypothetical protein
LKTLQKVYFLIYPFQFKFGLKIFESLAFKIKSLFEKLKKNSPATCFPFSLIFSPKRPFGLVATRPARPKPARSGPPASSPTSGSRHPSVVARSTVPRAVVRLRPPFLHGTRCHSTSSSFSLPQPALPPLHPPPPFRNRPPP